MTKRPNSVLQGTSAVPFHLECGQASEGLDVVIRGVSFSVETVPCDICQWAVVTMTMECLLQCGSFPCETTTPTRDKPIRLKFLLRPSFEAGRRDLVALEVLRGGIPTTRVTRAAREQLYLASDKTLDSWD